MSCGLCLAENGTGVATSIMLCFILRVLQARSPEGEGEEGGQGRGMLVPPPAAAVAVAPAAAPVAAQVTRQRLQSFDRRGAGVAAAPGALRYGAEARGRRGHC